MSMALQTNYDAGVDAAMRRYGVKVAAPVPAPGGWKSMIGDSLKQTATGIFGRPFEAARQLHTGTAFKPFQAATKTAPEQGMLNLRDNLWGHAPPKIDPQTGKAPGMIARAMPWVNRAFTLGFPALEAGQALMGQGDPSKGKWENVAGAVGGGLGFAMGNPVGGIIGGQMISNVGRGLAGHVGKMFDRPPAPPPQPQYQPQQYPDQYPPQRGY